MKVQHAKYLALGGGRCKVTLASAQDIVQAQTQTGSAHKYRIRFR